MDDPRSLIGTWHVRRTVEDRRERRTTHLRGRLTITEAAGSLDWHEELTWHLPEGDTEVTRHLALVREDDAWWVRFEDGRDFHPWTPGRDVVHPCAPDTYRGRVGGTTEEWSVVWEVSGPRKDYRMETRLRRP